MSIAASHRPDPDELATFIDGQLSGEERQKLESHLGACEACREIVAESLQLLEDVPDETEEVEPEGARVLTHPGWRRTAWQLAPLAAAALLVLMLWPTLSSFLYGPVDSAGFIASYANPQALSTRLDNDWLTHGLPTFRGVSWVENLSPEKVAFRLGVRTVDLQVALKTGSYSNTRAVLDYVILLLEEGVDYSNMISLRYRGIRGRIEAGAELDDHKLQVDEQAIQTLREAEDDLEEFLRELQLESDYFLLGRWVAAGQLATMIGDQAYFGRRWFGRQARKLDRAELQPRITEQIRLIRKVAEGPVDEQALGKLRTAFDEIIRDAG